MSKRSSVPWEKIYDYTLLCGREHDPWQFVVCALEEIDEIVPYDQGLAYFLDENRKVQAQHLVNIKSRWSNMYLEYYSRLGNQSQRNLNSEANEVFGLPYVEQIIWSEEPMTEFIANYIMARGVKCSLTFVLFDLNSLPRAAVSLDRTRAARFNEKEESNARLAVAQLGNAFKNFFVSPSTIPGQDGDASNMPLMNQLTKREREVVGLLCQGLSPSHVSTTLHISISTTYKHIAHIYKKLQVSSQQELLVRVLGNR